MSKNIENIALLIDSDNTQISKMESIILEISKHGKILVKRAYGNWAKDNLKNWADIFRKLAIKPMQQIDYVKGKNATDLALTIDAMDFLYNSNYDIFAIVSSDSDFTPLAIRLREAGKKVIGIAKNNTSEAFISSCNDFIYLEKLPDEIKPKEKIDESIENQEKMPSISELLSLLKIAYEIYQKKDESIEKQEKMPNISELDSLLKIAYETYQKKDGFMNIREAGTYIKHTNPDFTLKKYGVKKLSDYLINHNELYEVKRSKGNGNVTVIEYKLKQ